jgi:hypothetical protein
MPKIGDRKPCEVFGCFAEMKFLNIGRRCGLPLPKAVVAGEAFPRTAGYDVWICTANPDTHFHFEHERHTRIKRCEKCGGPMFHDMRIEIGDVPVTRRPPGKGFAKIPLAVGWQCFNYPEHREIQAMG